MRSFSLLSTALLFAFSLGAVSGQDLLCRKTFHAKTRSEIEVTLLTGGIAPAGYAAVEVTVVNGTKIPRKFSLAFESSDNAYSSNGTTLSSDFSLSCPAMKSVRQVLSVPLTTSFTSHSYSGTQLSVTVTGTGMNFFSGHNETHLEENWPAILISKKLQEVNGSVLDTEVQSRSSGSSTAFGLSFGAKNLSEDWRCYIGYDGMLITDEEWLDLSPGSKTAILKWIRHGGHLRVYSSSSATAQSLGLPEEKNFSWGTVEVRNLDSTGVFKKPKALVSYWEKTLAKSHGPYRLSHQRSDFRSSWQPQEVMGEKTFNVVFFTLILLLFAVLVGPVNLFVFAKAGQRHRLFVTTPIISAGASVLLLVLIFFQDGFGGRGVRQLLIELTPEHTAHVVQEQFSRTGVLLSTGFTVDEPALASPVLVDESRWARATGTNNGGNSHYKAQATEQALNLSGDWFQSRSEQGHLIETIRPSRERVELRGSADAPELASTLAYPLEVIYYQDARGAFWKGENLDHQRAIKLTATTQKEVNRWLKKEASRYTERQENRIHRAFLRKGSFVAFSTQAPGIDTLKGIDWETSAIITGRVIE